MSRSVFSLGLGLLLSLLPSISSATDFKVEGKTFLLDGKPFQIRSGEMHYPRIPREEWGSRIRLAKAMGLNTISTYVFWNLHEVRRGEFEFGGEKDVAAFIRECGAAGMQVIVRPGPYVCAEWDLGGLPAWLLPEPGIRLRSTDPRFLEPAKAWMAKMGSMLRPLSVAEGGPVIMVQLENEFGNQGPDREYLAALEKALRSGGYQGTVFTSDGASEKALRDGGLPGVLKAVNFGGGAQGAFKTLAAAGGEQPDFTAEFWVGWFDVWGGRHHFIGAQEKMADFEQMMRTGASFNLYMFHGGTTRGLMSGANLGRGYEPTTDGYDYAAPLDESGRTTEKYQAFRMVIARALPDEKLPEVPKLPAPVSLGDIALTEQCRWLDSLPQGEVSESFQTMEDLGQTTGMMAYRTTVEGPLEGELALGAVKDRVQVLLDGKLLGISGRSTQQPAVAVKIPAGKHRLDLVVENMGRINYGGTMAEERKGLTEPVVLGGKTLGPFEQVGLPLQDPPRGKFEKIEDGAMLAGPAVYRAKFKLGTTGDTWLDLRGFGRGIVWFNGRNLGRYWNIGPAEGVFLPGCWMKAGEENELVVLELEATKPPKRVRTSARAIWGSGGKG